MQARRENWIPSTLMKIDKLRKMLQEHERPSPNQIRMKLLSVKEDGEWLFCGSYAGKCGLCVCLVELSRQDAWDYQPETFFSFFGALYLWGEAEAVSWKRLARDGAPKEPFSLLFLGERDKMPLTEGKLMAFAILRHYLVWPLLEIDELIVYWYMW